MMEHGLYGRPIWICVCDVGSIISKRAEREVACKCFLGLSLILVVPKVESLSVIVDSHTEDTCDEEHPEKQNDHVLH